MKSLGLLEVCGYGAALLCADAMDKAASIEIVTIDFDKPAVADLDRIPLLAQVKIRGSVSAVKEALRIGYETAKKYNDESDIIAHQINQYHEGIEALVYQTKIK
jgi:microcompartment protein CcmL/EutN